MSLQLRSKGWRGRRRRIAKGLRKRRAELQWRESAFEFLGHGKVKVSIQRHFRLLFNFLPVRAWTMIIIDLVWPWRQLDFRNLRGIKALVSQDSFDGGPITANSTSVRLRADLHRR